MEQQSLSRPAGSSKLARPFSYFLAALAFAGTAMFASACGDNGTGGGGGTGGNSDCVNGVIVNGVCEGKCTADKCLEGNVCVGNRCVLQCAGHEDCYQDGSQVCVPAKNDEGGGDISVCQFTGKPAGTGTGCPFGTECDNWRACPDGGTCFASQCGGDMAACVKDADACKDDANCIIGKCPDGSGCRVDCGTACGPWLSCQTTGEADADAYCTKRDCMSDDDCIDGYYCGIIRDPHSICGSNPQKGDNSFCGTTNDPCVSLPEAGTTRFEGSVCMLRKSCLKRGPEAPCKTDLDCSQIDSQACVDAGGETRCTPKCLVDSDCALDSECVRSDHPIGGMPATCGNNTLDAGEECEIVNGAPVFKDPQPNCEGLGFRLGGNLGCKQCFIDTATCAAACVPRYGMWKAPPGTFCAPCLSDEDCGAKGTHWACADLSGGMHACFDESFPDTCTKDLDCPQSPSGKHGTCLNENEGLSSADANYHHCYLPINLNNNKTSCW